ncbi:MAG: DUF2975 domain-containing protein [Cyclobacteriaceae bacterium]|jgi:hypothetical protein|nr:DUF2975 domain-containing protein [Cyclobacteriaceae bacterium]
MSKTNDFIWNGIQVICWFIFAGLCVQSGALIFNYIYSLFRPIATHNLHLGLNLSDLYEQSKWLYTYLFSFIITLSIIKALVFYYVLKLFKTIKLVKPFTENVAALISKISYHAAVIAMLSFLADRFARNISHKGYNVSDISQYWNDSATYLMMAAIVFVIALIFKKGIALQTESDLTV